MNKNGRRERLAIDQLTTREIGFVSDPELALVLRDLLDEIDRVFAVSGFRSALYLSVSAVEGILRHVLNLNLKTAVNALKYPKTKTGRSRQLNKLDLFDIIPICSELFLISPELETTYDELRVFRNYIHPPLELSSKRKTRKIDIGISEIAIGILNTTLLNFAKARFINGATWETVSGRPQYTLSNSQLTLPQDQTPTHSFLVTNHYAKQDFSFKFQAIFDEGAILNFVYNFSSEDKFRMIRIDKRQAKDDGLLICTDKYRWRKISEFTSSIDQNNYSEDVTIEVTGNSLKFRISGIEIKPQKGGWKYDPMKSVGFFNERYKVELDRLTAAT